MKELVSFFQGMFGIGVEITNFESIYYLKNNFMILIVSFLGMGPLFKNIIIRLKKGKMNKVLSVLEVVFIIVVLILSIAVIISSTFNPFIYFRF